MKYTIIVLSAVLLLIAHASHAQKEQRPPLSEATKAALRAYQTDHVQPTKKSIHAQLMAGLSAEERALIGAQRSAYEALRKEARQAKRACARDRKAGVETDRAAVMAPIREKQQALLANLHPIVEQHSAAVQQALADLKAHRAEWKAGREAIIRQHESAETVQLLEQRRAERRTERKEKQEVHKKDNREQRLLDRGARLLLWDGQRPPKDHRRGGKQQGDR